MKSDDKEITHDIGLTKTIAKKAIEAIGRYLVDNAERIAGEFDCMVEFELNAKFHTKTDEPGAGCPEISIRHQHYVPITEELQEMISKACVVVPENDSNDIHDEPPKHCLSCKSCDVCGGSNDNAYCSLNCNDVNISDIACEYYEPF